MPNPNTVIDIKKAATPASGKTLPDAWRSFRNEIDRLFDRFDGGLFFSPMRRMFDLEPLWRSEGWP